MFKAIIKDNDANIIGSRQFNSTTDAQVWFDANAEPGYTAEFTQLPDVDPEVLAEEKLALDNRMQKIVSLEQYVGKSLSLSDQKFVLETLLNLLFDPSSPFAKTLILLLSHKKQT